MADMVRMLQRAMMGVAIALLLFVVADVLLWEHKVSAGSGYDTVQVSQVSIATLKGTKEEYYSDGTTAVRCSRSVLPMPAHEGWFAPCWWQRTHRTVEVRY
jgi:hypothetical protein